MHREPILQLLQRYLSRFPEERVATDHLRQFVRANTDCFERSCVDGHITASAWIVSHDHSRILLTHHRKLGVWLQLGGHADGDPDTERVALTEAREESGMQAFSFMPDADGMQVLDLDVHRIPARDRDPEHLHLDVNYLLVAAAGQPLVISDESTDLAWFDWGEARRRLHDPSQLRKVGKAWERLRPLGVLDETPGRTT